MINSQFRTYDYYTFGDKDNYGQPTLSETPRGKIKIALNILSQSAQDNILYEDCSYVGLTHDANINDKYVIQFGDEKLKVLYVNPIGRLKQVFLKRT